MEAEPRAKQASRGRAGTWRLPPPFQPQARMGATSAQEGEALASLAARWALVPRQGASPADAKWPRSIEGVSGRRNQHWSRGCWRKRPRQLSHREDPAKAGVQRKPEAREATGTSEVGRTGGSGNNTPRTLQEPERACDLPKRRIEGDVITLLPRPRGRSQNLSLPPPAQAEGTAPGTNEYGCS